MVQPQHINNDEAGLFCPGCSKEIKCYDAANSSFYGCPNCYTFFEYRGDNYPVILRKFSEYKVTEPAIPIGTEGTFKNNTWRVVGFMSKEDQDGSASWREYLLYRKGKPYAVCAEFDGHWMYIWRTKKQSYEITKEYPDRNMVYEGEACFDFYQSYQFSIAYAAGEFDWNILSDETTMTAYEYIAPPEMLVNEIKGDQSDWFRGTYYAPPALAQAFDLPLSVLPRRRGVGAIQPATFYENWPALLRFTVFMVTLVVLTQIVFTAYKGEKSLTEQHFITNADSSGSLTAIAPLATESFEVKGPVAVSVSLEADVNNEWIEVPVSLVNETSGDHYEASKVLEFYYGTEGGEGWTEGNRAEEIIFSSIPSGKYHLNIFPYSEGRKNFMLMTKVSQTAPFTSNFLVIAVALLIYPAIQIYRRNKFENARWFDNTYE